MKKLSRRTFLSFTGAGVAVAAAPKLAALVAGRNGVEWDDAREDSLWTKEAPIPPVTFLNDKIKADVAIVGGGYTGLSCAYYLKKFRPELSVVLLESRRLGSGASSRNSGAVSASYRGLGKTPLTQRGFDRLMRFMEEEEIDCDLRRGGVVELFGSERAAKAHSAAGDARYVPAGELHEAFQSAYYAGALETDDYVTVHPGKLVAGHVKAAQRVGAELYEQSPVIRIKKGKPVYLSTPFGTVIADSVFIATNAYTPRLGLLQSVMMPVHQFTLATRALSPEEVQNFGLDRWPLRFERGILPVTNHLTPSGHFFIRIVLGYASFNSCQWNDISGATELARKMFIQRYPWVADVKLTEGWHGVTGHTLKGVGIAGPLMDGNVLVSAAYNGLGIMPGHNNGYLAACRLAGHDDEDARYYDQTVRQYPIPGELYRSLLFKPFMKLMTPV
jgi:gamma-glutamylputrescine oxidase